jgi:urocanate hydratase
VPFDTQPLSAIQFLGEVEEFYARLMESPLAEEQTGLAGKFLYLGELDHEGRALVVAGNIAGAASLAATADPAAQKQAIHDGVADFVVNSLDESLRVLKNQLRKRQAVAVCVGLAPAAVEREMQERGVAPDLLRSGETLPGPLAAAANGTETDRSRSVRPGFVSPGFVSPGFVTPGFVTWSVASAPAQWLPRIDAIALECLQSLDQPAPQAQRWVSLSPRYLGRMAKQLRMVRSDRGFADKFIASVRRAVEEGAIATEVEIRLRDSGGVDENFRFAPSEPSPSN